MSYLFRQSFDDELQKENLGNEPLIEEFIYRDTTNMIYAKPGHGKSVITANLALGAIGKNLVFDYLPSKISRIAYWQTEGSRDEQMGRLQAMQNEYGKIDTNRLSWHNTYIQIENQRTWSTILKELKEVAPFDLLIIDPIYALAGEGVLTEKFCSSLRGFNDTIKREFAASVLMNHHTPKDMMTAHGDKIEKDYPFGLQWLEGNLDGMYFFKQIAPTESYLELRKNRPLALIERLTFQFDVANWTVKVIPDKSTVTARQKVRALLLKKFSVNAFATTTEICREANISRRHLRRMKEDGLFDDIVLYLGGEDGKDITWTRKV